MELVYRAASNITFCIVVLLAYQKILSDCRLKGSSFVYLPLSFATYMFLMPMGEPFRTIGSILLLGALLRARKEKVNLAALALAFLFGYFLWGLSLLIATPIGMALFGTFDESFFFILFAIELLVYLVSYQPMKKTKNGMPHIDDTEVKSIVFLSLGITLSIWGIHFLTYQSILVSNPPLMLAAYIVLISVILGCGVFIIHHAKRHREGLEAEEQNKSLKELQHKYRTVVPAIGAFSSEVLERMADTTSLEQMKEQLSTLSKMVAEISEEFAVDDIGIVANSFLLPKEWHALQLTVRQALIECGRKEIDAFVKNRSKQWKKLSFSKTKFVRLVGNLLHNALRELDKSESDDKQILIQFLDEEDGAFAFELLDTAPAFPLAILTRLGQRGNSTNGSGNGYAEIFEFLEESKASFIITEWQALGCHSKTVGVVFDGKGRRIIRTAWRYDELKAALDNTGFEVEWYA